MKKFLSLSLALLLAMSVPVFATEQDIVDIAIDSPNLNVLVAALIEADLVDALRGDGPFTVFAPTDDAFQDLLSALDITAADLLAHPQLSEVLLYHVVGAKVMSTDLVDGMTAETLNGESITVDLSDGVKINTSNVIAADIEATNGVIHIIDTVLVPEGFRLEPLPETVVDIALANDDFSILVAALIEADLVGVLQGDGPFTVFAPTNDAFVELITALGISAEDLLAQPDLAKVLLYHVVSGKVMSGDLVDGLVAPTVNGESVEFDLTDGVFVNNSQVIIADLEAENGVIHVINSVLIPTNFTYQAIEEEQVPIPDTGVTSLNILILLSIMSLVGFFFTRKRITN